MSDNALESQGTLLAIDLLGTGVTYVTIPDVTNLNVRTGSAAVKDVTDLVSTAKEKRMGLPDEGQCTFTLYLQPKELTLTHAELVAAKADRQSRGFKVTLTEASSPTTYTFSGYVLSMPISAGVDGVIESNVTVEITGAVVQV